MPPERTRGHIKRNTIRAHFNSTRNSFINLSWFLLSRLKRGFAKYVFLLMLDLSTQTWFQSLKNISFFIWSTFNKQKWIKHFSKVNIPMGLHGNRLPSIFMLYFECACLQKKRGVATKLSDICAKNSKKKIWAWKHLTVNQDRYTLKLLGSGRILWDSQSQTHMIIFSKDEEKNLHFWRCFYVPWSPWGEGCCCIRIGE